MQATVHAFDPLSRTGSVIRDDGVLLSFDAQAFDMSGLRLVRLGQRVTLEVMGDRITSLGIVGIGHDELMRPA